MIEKIISISNVGTFSEYKPSQKYNWDGKLSKINLIYAPNGSGKTTLSTIFNSLSNVTPELLTLKQTINKKELPNVKLKCTGYTGINEYNGKKWNTCINNVLVFDIHFIEDYLFLSSISNEKNNKKLLFLILGKKGSALKSRFLNLKKKNKSLSIVLKSLQGTGKENQQIEVIKNSLQQNEFAQQKIIKEYSDYAFPIFEKYISTANKILSRFTNNITIKGLHINSAKSPEAIFNTNLILEVNGKTLRFKLPDYSRKEGNAKFTLSEGDKNAVALSFFLGMAELKGVGDKIIVFDDPLSSFDYLRKTSTVNVLSKIAQESLQFILTTHDITFAKALKDKLSFVTSLNLKIEKNSDTSFITSHDIDFETLSGYQKDLITIKSYKNNLVKTEEEKRKVIRCIRPILETIFKVKYNDDIVYNEWLGDIIGKIRKSSSNSPLNHLKTILPDIIDLNDYSKKYHHSEFDNEIINNAELDFFIDLLQKTILRI
ncbi:AAA family ATPase [Elizabethkingia anophelis]|uniref:AAA family ATPase n=1 Tax=Elizabethkingia anophelis TaxID=1117645 RepID=UPI002469C067|nr:AAA family ATPase [Elizabethkingia anophelis]WGL69891.1 AAA family ATPase [Elizabethkingia anophelis]